MAEDFTKGSIPRQLLWFAFPILLTNLLQTSMLLINSLWVGNLLGSTEFAAVTVGTTVMAVVLAFIFGLNNATLTIFGQLHALNNLDNIKSYLSAFVLVLLTLSLAIGLAGYLLIRPLLTLLNTPAAVMDPASIYLRINFLGILFLVGYNFIGTALRAFGDSRTPLYFVLLATVLTVVLGPLFIAGLNLGIAGAAYAFVMAQALALIYGMVFLSVKFKHHTFRIKVPKWVEIKTILELGVPSAMQMIVISAGITVILSLVNTLGADAVAGFGAAQRLDSIILLPGIALSTAVNVMAAQNIGVQKWQRVSKITQTGIMFSTLIMLLVATVIFVSAETLVRFFIQDEGSVAFGTTYLKTIAFFYPFIGLNFIFNGVVRGSGAMTQVLVLNIISLWLLRVPLAYTATAWFGDIGVSLGIGVSFVLSCIFSGLYYHFGRWRTKEIFHQA